VKKMPLGDMPGPSATALTDEEISKFMHTLAEEDGDKHRDMIRTCSRALFSATPHSRLWHHCRKLVLVAIVDRETGSIHPDGTVAKSIKP
jgi:hypothetical protein